MLSYATHDSIITPTLPMRGLRPIRFSKCATAPRPFIPRPFLCSQPSIAFLHSNPTRPLPTVQAGQAASSSYALALIVVFGGAITVDYLFLRRRSDPEVAKAVHVPFDENSRVPIYKEMPVPEGYLGNLTPEQEQKLKEFWTVALKTFGVQDQDATRSQSDGARPSLDATETDSLDNKKKSKRFGLFSRKHDDSPKGGSATEDDKYGQTAELKEILANKSPEVLRSTYWNMLKADHPDQLLLRFLRARKWDVDRALAMLVTTLNWRKETMNIDDDILYNGEERALLDEKSSDPSTQKEGHDFLTQFRMGKSFLHGVDKEGRPMTYVRARLHRGGEQTEHSLERFTVYVIETARLTLKAPVETACIVFDMTGFTLANMDYTPVKFMIKVFEANYPESLGAILVHKAPWVFQGIWKIIRGWLDPVVAAKVHFTNSIEDLSEFVPKNQVIKELDGDENWEYHYVEPTEGENKLMKDTAARDDLLQTRNADIVKYQQHTFDWIHAASKSEILAKIRQERNDVAQRLNDNYWKLDPYIRARSLYDRVGMIQSGGKIDYYPSHKVDNVD